MAANYWKQFNSNIDPMDIWTFPKRCLCVRHNSTHTHTHACSHTNSRAQLS